MKKTNFIIMSAISFFIFTGCGKASIDLNDYLTAEYSGYNTVGHAEYDLDIEKMITDNPEAFGLEKNYSDIELIQVEFKLDEYLTVKPDKKEGLSNGDTVTFSWENSNIEKIENDYPVRISCNENKITVSGLEDAVVFDPFENINVTFSGISPNGKITIDKTNAESGITYAVDKTDGLKNGDTVVISLTTYSGSDATSYLLEEKGKIPSSVSKEYIVEGLSAYAEKISDIPEEAMTAMEEHSRDSINAYIAKNWADTEQLKNIETIGNYLLTPKDPSIYVPHSNELYYIFKISAENNGIDIEYYYYTCFSDIIVMSDGTASYDLGSMDEPSGGMTFGVVYGTAFKLEVSQDGKTHNYYYVGYEDLSSLFKDQITSQIDKYNYETNIP